MAYGLRVWDAAGNLTLDTTTNAGRWLASVNLNPNIPAGAVQGDGGFYWLDGAAFAPVSTISTTVRGGSFVIPGFATGIPWWTSDTGVQGMDKGTVLAITRSGNTISWTITRPDTNEIYADFNFVCGVM